MEFDSNGPTSLMSQIEALIAPPSYETSKNAKKGKKKLLPNREKTYSRCNSKGSGKSNQKFCSACLDGGELVCCDRCPAAFHFLCIDPPMDDELPAGEWLCNRCKKILEQMRYDACLDGDKNDAQKENSNVFFQDNRRSPSSTNHAEKSEKAPAAEQAMITDPTVTEESNSKPTEADAVSSDELDELSELNEETMKNLSSSIDLLIKAATLENPKQFQLPLEYTPPIQLPGTSRKPYINPFSGQVIGHSGGSKQSATRKRQIYEAENGGLQIPFKTCFKCDKNCRKACLIQCDYCPLLYHLDCLDPPLTCPPLSTRWMCPNHVEQVLEQKLLTSPGLSERVRLWNSYTEIPGETVKLDFIRKASKRSAPYRVRVSTAPSNLVRVPESVKQMYRRPVELIPNDHVLLADSRVPMDEPNSIPVSANEKPPISRANEQEQCEWLACLMDFQSSVCEYLNLNSHNSKVADTSSNSNSNLDATSSTNCIHPFSSSSIIINSKDDASIDTISLPDDQSLTYFSKAHSAKRKEPDGQMGAAVRAQLCPIIVENHLMRGANVPMRGSSLRIGANSSMDLNLLNYGHCNRISDQHAMIFYDEDSKHFELINYSEFGTEVDKVKYSCDYLTNRTYSTGKCKDSSIVATVKSLIKKSRRERAESGRLKLDDDEEEDSQSTGRTVNRLSNGQPERSRSKAADKAEESNPLSAKEDERSVEPMREPERMCHCDRRRLDEPEAVTSCGWEGSAILNHGSLITFGCLEFTFSVTDFGVDYGEQATL